MSYEQLQNLVADFWLRDYRRDVRELNNELKKRTALSAGLEEAPPSVLTGDPSSLARGECIIVLGKNPKWRADGLAGAWAQADVIPSIRFHENEDFESYRRQRATYFHDDDQQHHGGHFTTLGNMLRPHFFGGNTGTAREFMRTRVSVLDVIPWWSENTNAIDSTKLSLLLEPLDAWRRVVTAFIRTLRPSIIILHGLGFQTAAEAMLDTKLYEFVWGRTATGRRVRGLTGQLPYGTRVLGHPLVTERRVWPGGDWSYDDLLRAWSAQRL